MSAAARFLLRRMVGHVVLLAVVCSCAYLLAAVSLNPRENYEGQRPPPPAQVVEAMLVARNLSDDVPLGERYLTWASGVVTGDLGSTWDGRPVGEEMARRVGASLRLLALGAVVGGVTGVLLGAWTGSRRYGTADRIGTAVSVLLISIPVVVIAVLLQSAALWANQVTGVELLRTTGESTPGLSVGFWGDMADRARHLVLPTLALALPQIAVFSRYQRGVMAEAARADYVRTARAKGLTRGRALTVHALRSSLIPAATYFGYSFAALFTGAVIVEKVFGVHGVGELLIDSVGRGDVNAVAAVLCFGAVCVLLTGALLDVVRVVLDPRVRTE
ncbi:ABC transporter permease [Nocardiopsis gilva]|nr:ABC transporter permease [Nocardiopsis gilva]